MKESACISGERVLEDLEQEIIEEKARAYRIALEQIYPLPFIINSYVVDYKRKLQRQFDVLFNTAKEIYLNPDRKKRLIKLNFPKYYKKTPLYSTLLLQIPPIFVPNFIRRVLRQLKKLNKRYFKRRINFLHILFNHLNSIKIETIHSEAELLRRIFENKTFLLEYIYSYIEVEQKKYRIIKKGGDWTKIPIPDFFHSFTLGSISFYQYVSSIWKTLTQYLTEFLELKVADMYHLKTLDDDQLEIVKTGKYRYKLVKEFPCSPQRLMEIFHDPEILMKCYPNKNIKIEKLTPTRLRYTLSEKIPLMKVTLQYDLVCEFKGNIEEWWVENSNYIKIMTGFAVYEETTEGNCRYVDVLVDFAPDDILKPFEGIIIPALERMGRKNLEKLMENIYQFLIAEDDTLIHTRRDECKEIS
ncbi:MAG: hypothetical protein HWN65_04670 [Candidatus Helarchaeota archaeon]|nr:hypothetical protein [Candidatus Helarchaeota archaeon]